MSHKNDSEIVKLSYESLNDQRLTGLGCDLYIVSSNGIGFPAHASVVCSQSDVFQVRNVNDCAFENDLVFGASDSEESDYILF